MATSITEVYNDVLNFLPYSLKGHSDIDDRLHKFYNKLIETNFIKHSDKFTFLCSALLRLPSINQQERGSKSILENWDLNSFDQIFYKTFIEGDKDEALSFYFYLLDWAGKQCGVESLSTSHILSKLFIADIDFKVGLIHDLTIKKPYIKVDKRRHLFEIFIPKSIFNTKSFENLPHLRLQLNKLWYDKEKFIKREDLTGRLYSFYKPNSTNHFEQVFEKFFNSTKINQAISELADYFKEFSKFRLYNKDDTLYKQISYCSVCISFLCLYYDCYVEYMLSIAKVDYKHSFRNEQAVLLPEYRNIGGLIIGYNCNSELSQEERAIFNLTSDRLASVIAGQFLYEEIEELSIKRKGYTVLKNFWDTALKDLTHNSSTLDKINEAITSAEEKLSELQKVLSRSTFNIIIKYINEIKIITNTSALDTYITSNCESIKEAIRIKPSDWANKLKNELNISLKFKTDSMTDYIFCDIKYLNHIIKNSITNSKDKNIGKENLKVSLTISFFKQDGDVTTDLSETSCIEFVLEDNGIGCNLDNITLSSTTYEPVQNEYRSVINSFGEVELASNNRVLLFSPAKEIKEKDKSISGFKTTIKIYKNG